MTILKSQAFGRSLIGVYLSGNNSRIFHPPTLLKPTLKKFNNTFEEPLCPLTINNSNLLGVYMVSNKSGIIIPTLIRDDELTLLKSTVNGEMNIGVINSIDNAFGNLILCNDKGAIISTFLKKNRKEIEDVLNVETVVYEFAGSYLPGSISLANNHGCVVSPLANDDEIDFLSSILKVDEIDVSTINRGMPYLSSGAVVNDKSGIFGVDSTGPEMMRLSNVLGL